MSDIFIWIFACFAIAGSAMLWRNKRRFDRTNEHGIQQHKSYGGKLRTESFDAILLSIAYVSAFVAAGLLVLADETILLIVLVIAIVMSWAGVRRPN